MTIEKKLENGRLSIIVYGQINTITAPQFAQELNNLEGVNEVIMDFANLEKITSAGLRVLLEVQCNMTDKGGVMIVKNVNEIVYEIFTLTGFINFLTIE